MCLAVNNLVAARGGPGVGPAVAIVIVFTATCAGCGRTEVPQPPATTSTPRASASRAGPLPRDLQTVFRLIAERQCDVARTLARSYVAKNGEDAWGYFAIGHAWHVQGNFRPAVPFLEQALERSPGMPAAHHALGDCHFQLGELARARSHYEALHGASPQEPDAPYGLGLIDLEEGDLDVAETRFRSALSLYGAMQRTDPRAYASRTAGRARCHARLADVYFATDDYEAAREELIATTTISPGTISALYTLSVVHRRLGEDALAEQALERYEAARAAIIARRSASDG